VLKFLIYFFSKDYKDKLRELDEEIVYLLENGIKAYVFENKERDDMLEKLIEDKSFDSEYALFLADNDENIEKLKSKGLYVCGMQIGRETIEKSKYVLQEVDDIDADYLNKVWQRLSKRPWMILETKRLLVRETTVSDVRFLYDIYADKSMTEYMEDLFEDPEDEIKYTKDYIEKVYEFNGFGIWSLIEKESGDLIGRAGFSIREGFDDIEIGFFIGKKWQKKGFAYEALEAILDFGVSKFNFKEVMAIVHKGNTPSINLLKKLGFDEDGEAVITENIYGGKYISNGYMSLGEGSKKTCFKMKWVYKE